MSYTAEQIIEAEANLARMVRTAKINGEEVTFETIAERRKQIAIMKRDVYGQVRVTHFNPGYNRGL